MYLVRHTHHVKKLREIVCSELVYSVCRPLFDIRCAVFRGKLSMPETAVKLLLLDVLVQGDVKMMQ